VNSALFAVNFRLAKRKLARVFQNIPRPRVFFYFPIANNLQITFGKKEIRGENVVPRKC